MPQMVGFWDGLLGQHFFGVNETDPSPGYMQLGWLQPTPPKKKVLGTHHPVLPMGNRERFETWAAQGRNTGL